MSRSTSVSGHINLLPPGSVRHYNVGAVVVVRVYPDPQVRFRSQPMRLVCNLQGLETHKV